MTSPYGEGDAHSAQRLLSDLVRCRSVTPADDGALALVAHVLEGLGFTTHHLSFGPEAAPTPNLYARIGEGAPFLCFAGHTDVVPPGENWRHDPFSAIVEDGCLYGRGTADMKGGLACALAATSRFLEEKATKGEALKGSIAFLVTGDEEGPAYFGTRAMLEWMKENNQQPDFCLLGEPTNPDYMGEMIKIGRRGSLNAVITIKGVQGHVAYPHLADNPLHRLIPLLQDLQNHVLDEGSMWFAPSSLQVTSIDTGNLSTNIIPDKVEARLNIRFNDQHTGRTLSTWLEEKLARYAPEGQVKIAVSGESFLTQPGQAVEAFVNIVEEVTGHRPVLDTAGGTSDARFITTLCPVAEFGLVNKTIHQCDEHVSLESLETLTQIYKRFIQYFGV